jgi:diguanylate cyclase (GGDEF)-like protein
MRELDTRPWRLLLESTLDRTGIEHKCRARPTRRSVRLAVLLKLDGLRVDIWSVGILAIDEQARLAALHELRILDTAPEEIYDDVVALAAEICEMPIAMINFVDGDRQWGKALIGLESSESTRDASFCSRTIQQDGGVLIVPDTTADRVWADNPHVTGSPGLRFYAGAAIVTDEGYALGSVCVADDRMPRELDPSKIEALRVLARQTASHLKLRRQAAELARANERLRELAIKDALTGLANRSFFEEALSLALHQRRGGAPGLLFCDMNGFKQINDNLGHHAGDELLQLTAQRLTESAREGDLVARLAGDEFVVLCPEVKDGANLDAFAERLTTAVARPTVIAGTALEPRISIGTATAHPGEEAAAFLRRADIAMYRVKQEARADTQVEQATAP